jgi:hypothetical protein
MSLKWQKCAGAIPACVDTGLKECPKFAQFPMKTKIFCKHLGYNDTKGRKILLKHIFQIPESKFTVYNL